MTGNAVLEKLEAALASHGMTLRGGFAPGEWDGLPEAASGAERTLLLVGNAGPEMYRHFFAAPESSNGTDNPLDSWTRRVIAPIAERFGAEALFPFGGPPWHPFQRWAMRAEGLRASPLGILIHPRFGVWHAYRAALLFQAALPVAPAPAGVHPCDTCIERPCLTTCPAGAVTVERYDHLSCAGHAAAPAGEECSSRGCMARRACPVGREHAYPAQALRFHMAAFLHNHAPRNSEPAPTVKLLIR